MKIGKKPFIIILCILLSTVCIFADTEKQVSTGSAIIYDIPTGLMDLLNVRSIAPNAIEGELVNVEKTVQRVRPQDANGFKAVLLSLIGDYETVITDYTYQSGSSGYYSHSIQIERDWSWICSASIFAIVVFCVFRCIGTLIKR